MKRLIAVLAALLVCGCTFPGEQQPLKYVCPEGQLAEKPSDCAPSWTTTTASTTTTTTTTGTSSTTSTEAQATTTTSRPTITTSTLCDDSKVGYVVVTDSDISCYRGYMFRVNPDMSDFSATAEGQHIGFFVETPGKEVGKVQATTQVNGNLGFEYKGLAASVMCVSRDLRDEDNPHYAIMVKFE
jgi:hypothetical protein